MNGPRNTGHSPYGRKANLRQKLLGLDKPLIVPAGKAGVLHLVFVQQPFHPAAVGFPVGGDYLASGAVLDKGHRRFQKEDQIPGADFVDYLGKPGAVRPPGLVGQEKPGIKQGGNRIRIHKQDPVCPFQPVHDIDFLPQQVFVEVLRVHKVLAPRVIAGIPAHLADKVRVVGQGEILYQGRLSGALAPQNQDLFRIIGLADLRYIIPVGEGPIPNLRGADRDLSPVKVNDVTFWGVQRFKAVAPQIVAAAEYGISSCLFPPGLLQCRKMEAVRTDEMEVYMLRRFCLSVFLLCLVLCTTSAAAFYDTGNSWAADVVEKAAA